jgi:hypothetical protein
VWLAYTIHGNESASFETMMQVVYQLAASDEPATLEMLKNCVVLINTGTNPDGHERFVTWYNSNAVGDPNPLAAEHREPWSVYGRLNRYRFDLNRDNIASTQRETQNMQRAYLDWNPQIFVDHHGQPSQYFFPPAALPVNPNLPPEQTSRWLTAFGRTNAREFDARGWSYYTRDIFDLFYPGYWDSWPSLNGATGMTYETDGGGFKGLRYRREDDSIVTFRSSIAKHYVASLATLETATVNARARLSDYYDFKRTAVEEGGRARVRRFVILPGTDAGRAAELVKVFIARRNRSPSGGSRIPLDTRARLHIRRNTRTRFPRRRIHRRTRATADASRKALLEPNTELDPSFAREQTARLRRNERRGANASREDYAFYDITAWSLPLAFGVEAYWTEDAGAINAAPLRLEENAEAQTQNQARTQTIVRASSGTTTSALAPGGVTGRASVAYVIPYNSDASAALVARLLQEDFRLGVATKPLNAGGRDYPRGTIVIRVGRNPETIHNRVAQLAQTTGVTVSAVNTGFIETGDTGIGSETIAALRRPRIIVIADEPVSQTSYGAMWWTLDRFGIQFTPMTIAALRRARLDEYNTIIMPDGSPGAYSAALGKSGIDTLRGWCERGGTLVTVKGASVFAALKDVNLTSARLVGSADDEESKDAKPAGAEQRRRTSHANTNAFARRDRRRQRHIASRASRTTDNTRRSRRRTSGKRETGRRRARTAHHRIALCPPRSRA